MLNTRRHRSTSDWTLRCLNRLQMTPMDMMRWQRSTRQIAGCIPPVPMRLRRRNNLYPTRYQRVATPHQPAKGRER